MLKKIEDSISLHTDNLFLFLLVFDDKYFQNFINFSNISEYHKSYCQLLDAFFNECDIVIGLWFVLACFLHSAQIDG